jgi:hypothetical protein
MTSSLAGVCTVHGWPVFMCATGVTLPVSCRCCSNCWKTWYLHHTDLNSGPDFWFQHDNALAHCTNVICEYLDEHFGNRWIGHGDPINWPPQSPDLTPLDFFLRGYTQSLVYETLEETQQDLVARIAVAAGTIWEVPGIFQSSAQHRNTVQNMKWSLRPPFWATFIISITSIMQNNDNIP